MILRCASPTCRATVESHGFGATLVDLVGRAVRSFGWREEQQPGDEEPRPYCRRCQL